MVTIDSYITYNECYDCKTKTLQGTFSIEKPPVKKSYDGIVKLSLKEYVQSRW